MTKSCSRMARVCERTSRVINGQETRLSAPATSASRPMPPKRSVTADPKMAVTRIASKSPGKAKSTSAMRVMTKSTLPPMYPAGQPQRHAEHDVEQLDKRGDQ